MTENFYNDFLGVIFPTSRNLLNPLFTFEATEAPEGFYDVVGFEGDVDPEGWPVEDEAGQNAERNSEDPQENIVGNHKHFRVTTAAENALCHDGICGAEDYDDADSGHELFCDFYGFFAYLIG